MNQGNTPAEQAIDRIVAAMTPAALEEVIRALAREKGGSDDADVPSIAVASIVERLLVESARLSPGERTHAHAMLAPKIIREVARIPGLRVIEND